ncbi:hypothetical protein JCM10295v2_001962 [Rhodotorula toruloides]
MVEHASRDEDSPPSVVASSERRRNGRVSPAASRRRRTSSSKESAKVAQRASAVAQRASAVAFEPIKLEKLINYSEHSFVYCGSSRHNLLLDLLYLHQYVHLEHGGAAPRKTLVDADGDTRWIDHSGASAHHSCKGAECGELSVVCDEMELGDKEEEVRKGASERGLRW